MNWEIIAINILMNYSLDLTKHFYYHPKLKSDRSSSTSLKWSIFSLGGINKSLLFHCYACCTARIYALNQKDRELSVRQEVYFTFIYSKDHGDIRWLPPADGNNGSASYLPFQVHAIEDYRSFLLQLFPSAQCCQKSVITHCDLYSESYQINQTQIRWFQILEGNAMSYRMYISMSGGSKYLPE